MAYITPNLVKNVIGTTLYIEDAIQQGFLYEGVNNITQTNDDLPFIIDLDYVSQENPYQEAIYSQDDKNKIKIWFNNVELEDADTYVEKLTRIARILPNDGSKRFSLNNFISTSIELILHNVDLEDIQDQVKISIGTLISENTYEYVPLGIFNIQDIPQKDGNKVTLKLRDNRVKFDFNYDVSPLIESLGGAATKKQILDDICTKASVQTTISSFDGDSDLVGVYDNTITATTYISYLMEQAGLIATIDRQGRLIAIDLSDLYTWKIPLSIIESYEIGEPYSIERVVYETGITKYQTSDDETLNTLYLNSANPYITRQEQVNNILSKLSNFEIDSVVTKRVLGNPAIDPYDLIQVYNDLDGTKDVVFTTLANTTYTFNGVHRDIFDTQIGKEQRKENVSVNGEPAFRKYARTSIDNLNAEIDLISSETKIFSNELVGVGTITLSNAYKGTLHRLEIVGNMTQLTASNLLKASEDLVVKDTELIVDNTNKYLLDFLGNDLYYTDENNYLKYVYEEGKQWIEEYVNGVLIDKQESTEEIYIEIDETSTLSFPCYPQVLLKSIYLIKNDYTSTFTNQMDIIAQVNLAPGNATIRANKIKLEGYTTINNGFGVDLEGNMFANNGSFSGNVYLENGNKVIGGEGMFANLQYTSTGEYRGWGLLGFTYNYQYQNSAYQDLIIDCEIPKDFTINSAYLTLDVSPANAWDNYNNEIEGKPRDLKLYKNTNTNGTFTLYYGIASGYWYGDGSMSLEEIPNAFGSTSYTPSVGYAGDVATKTTIDIKTYLESGERNQFVVRSSMTMPTTVTDVVANTGIAKGYLNVFGYMSVKEEEE